MELRAPAESDAEAVTALLVARDIADLGTPDVTLDDVYDEWRASDYDLSRDAALVDDGGEVVGYATVRRPGSMAVVSPAHEGRGIGLRLLRWTEHREREWGRDCHRQWIASTNHSGRELLIGAGYQHVRSYSRMTRALDASDADRDTPAPPNGHVLRPVDAARDAAELHALDAASFVVNPDYRPEPLDLFREEHLEAHDFEPRLSIVAHDGARITGFLLARQWREEQAGFIDLLGVHPEHQRRGLATAMLQTAFRQFALAELSTAELGVASDNSRALALYARVGMRERFRYDTYERPLR